MTPSTPNSPAINQAQCKKLNDQLSEKFCILVKTRQFWLKIILISAFSYGNADYE